jgi:hypothetical protein
MRRDTPPAKLRTKQLERGSVGKRTMPQEVTDGLESMAERQVLHPMPCDDELTGLAVHSTQLRLNRHDVVQARREDCVLRAHR